MNMTDFSADNRIDEIARVYGDLTPEDNQSRILSTCASIMYCLFAIAMETCRPLDPRRIVSEHGNFYRRLATPSDISRGEANECYFNAYTLAVQEPYRFAYVEGFISDGHEYVPHAWVTDREGRAIDITLPESAKYAYFGVLFNPMYLVSRSLYCDASEPLSLLSPGCGGALMDGRDSIQDAALPLEKWVEGGFEAAVLDHKPQFPSMGSHHISRYSDEEFTGILDKVREMLIPKHLPNEPARD